MRILTLLFVSMMALIGCAKVQVEAPKEPIKVDISMRLDVYQHVEKDIDDIEDIVSGKANKPQSRIFNGISEFFVRDAYALEGLSPEVEQAAYRRRDRNAKLNELQATGVVGEGINGLVSVQKPDMADGSVNSLVEAENKDRMIIYKGIAQKNGTSVEEVQALYAKRQQEDAPSGTPIEVTAGYWSIK